MRFREFKLDALTLSSKQKALSASRRLVLSAKLRTRQRQDGAANLVHIGRLDPYVEDSLVVSVPETIERPPLPPVLSHMIGKFEPELADIPVEYAREALASMGTRLMGVFEKCRVDPPRLAVRSEVNLIVTDTGLTCLPTHALAIHSPAEPSTGSPSDRANNLDGRGREMPESRPRPPPNQIIFSGGEIANGYRIPLVTCCLPMPQAFEPLMRYLYTHDNDELLNALLPMKVPFDVSGDRSPLYVPNPGLRQGVGRKQRLNRVASECFAFYGGQISSMYQRAKFLEGFWRNAIAVAVSDDGMWETLQLAYEALVQAMKWARDAHVQIFEREARDVGFAARMRADFGVVPIDTPQARAMKTSILTQRYVQSLLSTGQGNCYPPELPGDPTYQ
ncbi:uncharacterized protein B0H18DRAFT_952694 [Fomitopsis serialis]|uniref:uncharacterized protein n=1 Tax=Fomitopsis serialis TaxID=139415 RepID=UPI00200785A2|nr:uncharacterized protein B0H18DRAFT_952694 [Neoantrodia serialis]KAH9931518.1 hypothetical protein B0H18DRAFT_952694 [Neoantrodia serialis]